jgi:hypothetical protein
MQIKNIFFPLPVIVDLINDNGEEERKLIFYDQINNNFLPLDHSISDEDLKVICEKVTENFDDSIISDENYNENLSNFTDLNKIPNLIKKAEAMKESRSDKFRENKSQS